MIDGLNSVALTAFGVGTTWAEVLGFLTGLLNVWLLVRQHVLNWPLGILNVLLLMLVFGTAGLYADMGLQVVYVILGLYGWWAWLRGGADHTALVVRPTTRAEWLALAVAGVLLTGGLWLFLDRLTGSTVPLADAVTTALSLLATYGQTRKLVESWWLWIAADLIYIPLYCYKELWLTAILYVAFLALCVAGLRSWRRAVTA
ncbi:nicotinamide mononucleotide transporter [Actinoplanes sp. SE50]|uniref:nicotinamide riboside transporter PnuC n=1 Tax=unclassified Actinoplanes TaxID=2626549 RepID=UPI00023EC8A8|nr:MULTISPECIES: nicotinamide riboside transporter PnuC [unclassified Actinoplanes]AEV81465.1 Nicotinamide riboside transporter pnuC [Actinoplanes sp. SE50/110]ATO79868.1 nicotinamide mononucleotide transporter [Actinoplanes sp. SE50]SLL97270.1 nicotinamide mononucleotide transporter [Actinoplanes sp. SE50/110]